MTAFICLLALGILIYLYRVITQTGGGLSLDQAESGSLPTSLSSSPWAVPVALAIGWLLKDLWPVLGFPFHVMCHELGHSLVSWLAGRWSFPVIAGVAITDLAPSLFLSALVAGALAWTTWQAVKNRCPLLLFCCAALLAGFIYLQFIAGQKDFEEYLLFGGHAGEFVFPAVLIAAFYYRGPINLRWDWFRYPVMAAAACSLAAAWHFWLTAGIDPVTGIYGINISDPKVSGQDIARLVAEYGWTAQLAADRYLLLGKAAWFFVALFYSWFLLNRPAKPLTD